MNDFIKNVSIIVPIIVAIGSVPVFFFTWYVIPQYKGTINELMIEISDSKKHNNILENKISKGDEKYSRQLLHETSTHREELSDCFKKTEAENFKKNSEISAKNKKIVQSLKSEIYSFKKKLRVYEKNKAILKELSELETKKISLKQDFIETSLNLKKLNSSLASYEHTCIDPLHLVQLGRTVTNFNVYAENCRVKKGLELEHDRLNDWLNVLKNDIDLLNGQKQTLYNKINVP